MGFACVRCGQDLPAEARFCLRCGAPVDGAPHGRPDVVFRALAGPSVGREAERAALSRAWGEVAATRALRVVAVVGPPGAGKSRLVRDLLEAEPVPSWTLRCASSGEALGLAPLTGLLLELCDAAPGTDVSSLGERLAAVLPEDDALVARLLCHTERGTGVTGAAELPGDLGLALRGRAGRQPGVLVVEDLDAATQRLRAVLAGALATCHDVPMLVAVTASDAEATSCVPVDLLLQLDGLRPAEVAELLLKALGGSPAVEQLVVPVARAADGSPLLLEQLLALLVDESSLRLGPAGWELVQVPGDLPRGLDEVTTARVAHLRAAERRVLECAAVLGDEVGMGDLLSLSAGGQDPSPALDGLVGRELLQPVVEGQTYRFPHTALRQAVYRATPKRRLSELHLHAADHLERGAPTLRERIAVHLEQAVTLHSLVEPSVLVEPLARRAAYAWHDLGRSALLQSELHGAKQCLERGLMVAPSGSPERPALLQALGEVQLGLGEVKTAVRLSQEAAALADSAGHEAIRLLADLCRLRGEAELGTISPRAALGPMRASATRLEARREWARAPRAWLAVAGAAQDACEWEAAAAAATRACRRARETSSADLGLCLVRSATVAAHGPTPVVEAREICRDALHQVPADTLASALCTANAALVAGLDGREQEARELFDYALDVSRWRNTPGVLGEVLLVGGRLALAQGQEQAAAALFAEAGSSLEQGWPGIGLASAYEAYSRARASDLGGAREVLGRTPVPGGDPAQLGLHALELLVVAGLVDALLLRASDPVSAVSAASAAVQVAEHTAVPVLRGEAHRVLSEALARVEATDDARAALDVARELYLAKGAQVLVGRLPLDLASH